MRDVAAMNLREIQAELRAYRFKPLASQDDIERRAALWKRLSVLIELEGRRPFVRSK